MYRGACYLYRVVVLLCSGLLIIQGPTFGQPQQTVDSLDDVLHYISEGWHSLQRSLADCKTYEDLKTDDAPILYLPSGAAIPDGLHEMRSRCRVDIEHLPEGPSPRIERHGLLYLPNPYVVPGGQFNEMYGWDSYFIIRGLLRDHRRDVAKGMVENFFYEIEHYGGVLNANRTYYLGRSQPPFLTSMILAVYQADKSAGESDLPWLKRAYALAVEDYEQWTREPHLAGDTGLSRYFDEGEGPVPEIIGDPNDYYRGVAQFFLTQDENSPRLMRQTARGSLPPNIGPIFDLPVCEPGTKQGETRDCSRREKVSLSSDFYKGDRSMRESGFDVTFRFGPYGADTHLFAPVCLNSLLYKTELDLEQISLLLDRKQEARQWAGKAATRRARIEKYLWDPERGLFFDYNFVTHTRSQYEYAATFYPLWVGLASKEQAGALAQNLSLFEHSGGLAMSRMETHAQWDYPYGWAPIHLLAIEGLRRYGYAEDADRLSLKFLTMVLRNFRRNRTISEKYDVVTQSDVTHIAVGYDENVTGFGWTNGVFLELLHESPKTIEARLRQE